MNANPWLVLQYETCFLYMTPVEYTLREQFRKIEPEKGFTCKIASLAHILILSKQVYKFKSAYKPSGPSDRSLFRFLQHEVTRILIYSPLDEMLVHRRVTPSIMFIATHLNNWVERPYGVLTIQQKSRKFRLKVKWNSNFLKNSFGNCRLPPEVVLFFRSKRNGGNFLNI